MKRALVEPVHSSGAHTSATTLRDYTFIGDGERGALIGPRGDVAWMCFPGWSDGSVFAGLIDSGGFFRVTPTTHFVPGGYYEGGTLIWRSRFVTHDGIIECRNALSYPGSPERAILLRRVYATEGGGDVVVEFAPANDYGRRPLRGWRRSGDAIVARDGDLTVRLQVPERAEVLERKSRSSGVLGFRLKLAPGEHHDFVAEFISGSVPLDLPDADECWRATETTWRSTVPDCTHVLASEDVARSVAVLRGMTDHHGGTVAAATTSLPERDGGDRDYDYRFCWIRDTCYVGHAGAALGGGEAMLDDAVRWVSERLLQDKDRTAPAYLANGEPIFMPESLGLPGYPGATDIIGNRVCEQFQLDLFGEALALFARAAECDRFDASGWRAANIALEAIERRWNEPEAGIWELEPRLWTHSRLICVAGLRAMASAGAEGKWAARALGLADHILDRTNSTSLHGSGRWKRAPDDNRPDASLLLAEVRGGLSPSDPRSVLTRSCIAEELGKDHFLYRYVEPGHELGEDEGAFLICNFWMSLAQLGAGAPVESARWFERGRSAMGTSGLFCEEFDVAERQLRGNLPQAFVHAMFVETAAAQGGI